MKPDFNTMTKGELRAYVIAHPNDRSAFHTFVDVDDFMVVLSIADSGGIDRDDIRSRSVSE